jgi:hypothetical protein
MRSCIKNVVLRKQPTDDRRRNAFCALTTIIQWKLFLNIVDEVRFPSPANFNVMECVALPHERTWSWALRDRSWGALSHWWLGQYACPITLYCGSAWGASTSRSSLKSFNKHFFYCRFYIIEDGKLITNFEQQVTISSIRMEKNSRRSQVLECGFMLERYNERDKDNEKH